MALGSDRDALRKLMKILEMTSSDNDSEVIVAARMAQRLLKSHNTNYQELYESLQRDDPQTLIKIQNLERVVKLQKKEIAQLQCRNTFSKSKAAPAKFLGPLKGLRNYLINNLSLRNHERALLEQITEIQPKSKEAYLVLICARRYGVSYKIA